ncbi:MAG TPA: hypothetical protein ENI87_03145 [bacterium]|nr:hypothetical protein [bacterium]
MRSILLVLLSSPFLPAQLAPAAPLAHAAVFAGAIQAPPLPAGTDVWAGAVRSVAGSIGQASLSLQHTLDSKRFTVDWQLAAVASQPGSAVADGEVRYRFATPAPQVGVLHVAWNAVLAGAAQASLVIDVGDDGVIDASAGAVLPVAFQGELVVRIAAAVDAQAGTLTPQWGASWNWSGNASAILSVWFEPTHADITTSAVQPAVPAPALIAQPNLLQGIDFDAICPPNDDFALLALGFAPTAATLPLSSGHQLLLAPAVTLAAPVQSGGAGWAVSVPVAVRPATFLAQVLALDVDAMTLTAGDLLLANVP